MSDDSGVPPEQPSVTTQPNSAPRPQKWASWGGTLSLIIAIAVFKACSADFSSPATSPSPAVVWQEFHPTDEGFVVRMPGTPSRSEDVIRASGIEAKQVTYMLDRSEAVYGLGVAKLPIVAALKGEALERVMDTSVDFMLRNSGTTLAAQRKISLNGYPGREVTATRNAQGNEPAMVLDARVYLVHDTQYVLMVIRTEAQRYTVMPDKFYESFQLLNP